MVATSLGQLTVHYDFTTSLSVPDNNGQVAVVQNLGGLAGLSTITDVNARMNLTTGTPGQPDVSRRSLFKPHLRTNG